MYNVQNTIVFYKYIPFCGLNTHHLILDKNRKHFIALTGALLYTAINVLLKSFNLADLQLPCTLFFLFSSLRINGSSLIEVTSTCILQGCHFKLAVLRLNSRSDCAAISMYIARHGFNSFIIQFPRKMWDQLLLKLIFAPLDCLRNL